MNYFLLQGHNLKHTINCVSVSSYFDLPSDTPRQDATGGVSIQRCKPCASSHDRGDTPTYSPTGCTQYVLINFSNKSPHYERYTYLRTQNGEDRPTTIGSLLRWGHRGHVRSTARVPLEHPGSESWTSRSFPTKYCTTEPALRICTDKQNVYTARCELVTHNGYLVRIPVRGS